MAGDAGVVLRWFGADFHAEDASDDDLNALVSSYQNHLQGISALASSALRELIATNLHDGVVRDWQVDGDDFRWALVIGDLQVGYELATIVYKDATLIGVTPEMLRVLHSRDPRYEMVSDELDVADVGRRRLEHRFEFWPRFVFAVQFGDVRISREPLAERDA